MIGDDILVEQKKLQVEACNLISEIGLIPFLSKYGRVVVVGSLATALMTWRDIDIEVVTDKTSIQILFEIVEFLIRKDKIKNIMLQDNTDFRIRRTNPDGMYIGFQYCGNKIWNCSVWIFYKQQLTGKDDIQWLNTNMTTQKRKDILTIKSQIAKHPNYRKTIFSIDIYNAVINENIKNIDEFLAYLDRIGKKFNIKEL